MSKALDKPGALIILERWTTAFNNVDGIVALFASDALFLGSGSKSVIETRDEIRKYFTSALLDNRPCSTQMKGYSVRCIEDETVVIVGLDRNEGIRNGAPFGNDGRVTFVISKLSAEWKIVHFHRSRIPE